MIIDEILTTGSGALNIQHIYYIGLCTNCGLENRAEPWRASADTSDWKNVGMTEWRLVGPDLAALIVYLTMDMRVTRRKVKLFLQDVFGLQLSIGTLQNCIVESARTLEPVEEQLIEDLCSESLMHADEASHNEAGTRLWLWIFITSATALFLIGYRTKEIFTNLFDAFTPEFNGYLMTEMVINFIALTLSVYGAGHTYFAKLKGCVTVIPKTLRFMENRFMTL